MIERRGELRLANEPVPEGLVLGELGRKDLQSDLPAQPNLFGQVEDPIPPRPRTDART